MIILGSTSDVIQVITGSAVAMDVHASWVDNNAGTITPGRTNTPISTATTTPVVASPAASTYRNVKFLTVRNESASTSNAVTITHSDGTNVSTLWYGILGGGMSVQIDDRGIITVFSAGGIALGPISTGGLYNHSTATVSAGYAADTYMAGSNILIPAQGVRAGTRYRCKFNMTKTAAGTATPIVQIRIGTAATTADTSRCSFTFSAGTAATDTGMFIVDAVFRTVGSGTSAVLQGHCELVSQPTTGLSSLLKGVATTSAGFDSTVANSYIGVSFNGGTSFSGTNQYVEAELFNI